MVAFSVRPRGAKYFCSFSLFILAACSSSPVSHTAETRATGGMGGGAGTPNGAGGESAGSGAGSPGTGGWSGGAPGIGGTQAGGGAADAGGGSGTGGVTGDGGGGGMGTCKTEAGSLPTQCTLSPTATVCTFYPSWPQCAVECAIPYDDPALVAFVKSQACQVPNVSNPGPWDVCCP